ncbi:YdcF family protein [Bergeriella denitrificans]|uniref:Periplasmic protein n=1 Tax=Bergeriella denitrificans TaxID=494 RepID=A0A378UIB1_BERDE|nr:YdcF family protein [Bergeriella denitrificans]STZ77114.1 Periplasmic protein [Bergeriella denitrificans]
MKILIACALILLLLLGGGLYAVYRAERAAAAPVTPEKSGTAMVLGNTVNRRGKPNPCLRNRVEAGVWLYRAGLAEKLLMSGGTDRDGANQAEAMRQMALTLGVPPEHILIEPQSRSTYENIAFSHPLLPAAERVILVSDGFHLARARWLAARHWPGRPVQILAAGSCGDTPANLWRKRLREVLAWVKAVALH